MATIHPVSAPQRRLWVIHQLEPTSPAYNITAAIRLEGVLNEAALRRALDEVVRRHETLRTTFAEVDGQPVQVVHEARSLPIADDRPAATCPSRVASREIARRLREEAARPFDLDRGPLVRVVMLRLSDREHVVLLNLHHIVADGLSIGVLLRELAALYYPFSRGLPSPLPRAAAPVRRLRPLAGSMAEGRRAAVAARLLADAARRARAAGAADRPARGRRRRATGAARAG